MKVRAHVLCALLGPWGGDRVVCVCLDAQHVARCVPRCVFLVLARTCVIALSQINVPPLATAGCVQLAPLSSRVLFQGLSDMILPHSFCKGGAMVVRVSWLAPLA